MGDGPFQAIERINENAYQLELSGEYNFSTSFNVFDLSSFDYTGEYLRMNPLEEWGNDENHGAKQIPSRPIIRSRRAQLNEAFNGLIQEVKHNEMTQNNRLTIFLKSKIQKQIGKIDNQCSSTKPLIPNDVDTLDEQHINSSE